MLQSSHTVTIETHFAAVAKQVNRTCWPESKEED